MLLTAAGSSCCALSTGDGEGDDDDDDVDESSLGVSGSSPIVISRLRCCESTGKCVMNHHQMCFGVWANSQVGEWERLRSGDVAIERSSLLQS